MKAQFFAASALVLTLSAANAQPLASARPGSVPAGLIPGRQTGDSREWLKVESVDDAFQGTILKTNRAFVELATGMSYWDGQQWLPSDPTFDTTTNGFIASRMQHKVHLAENINDLGTVTLVTPDGKVLRSTPIGIGLYDSASGRSMIIGETTDSIGTLVDSNRVVYANAFKGVCADVIYTIHKYSFEQDVIITGKLNPEDYGFPTNTTRIQIFTEFYGTVPEPDVTRRPLWVEQDENVRSKMASPDLVDESLQFGQMFLATGRSASYATLMNDPAAPAAPVAKQFATTPEGRTVLVESVQYSWISKDMAGLPDCQAEPISDQQQAAKLPSKARYAQLPSRIRPTAASAKLQKPKRQITEAALNTRPGVAVDYIATLGGGTMLFQGDTTYLVSGWLGFYGAVTIEGGAVLKYKYGASLNFYSSVSCRTSRYRPAFFTAVDDDSVGETMNGYPNSGYTGTINPSGYANPAINLGYVYGQTLSNLRFTYCQEAIQLYGSDGTAATVDHAQLANCVRGITVSGCGCGSGSGGVYLTGDNLLFSSVQTPFTANYLSYGTVRQCTVDQAARVLTGNFYPVSYWTFVNTIVANTPTVISGYMSISGSYNGFYNCAFGSFGSAVVSASGQPFQTGGVGGTHYLASGHSFKNAGTTSGLPTDLINELKLRTTDPPVVISGPVSSETILSPVTARDYGTLDLGYHYSKLDYILNNVTLSAALKLTNGVAVGLEGSPAVNLQSGASINSFGTPSILNEIVSAANVQEQPVALGGSTVMALSSGTGSSTTDFRFTDFSMGQGTQGTLVSSGGNPFSRVSFMDCSFHQTTFTLYPGSTAATTVAFTNNLLERCKLIIGQNSTSVTTPFRVYFYNNLMVGDPNSSTPGNTPALALAFDSSHYTSAWEIHDNLFDKATQTITPNNPVPSSVHLSNNGFTSGTTRGLVGTSDQTGFGLVYLTGALGSYYLPWTTTLLINHGSRSAASAGLYHYTTQTSQVKEANSTVDIGFHYVSLGVDSTGLAGYWPFDEGSGTTAVDYSGGGFNGTLVNSPSWTTGMVGTRALSFNGVNQYVNLNDNLAVYNFVQNTLTFTISAWVKINNLSPRSGLIANTPTTGWRGFTFMWETYGSGYGDHSLRFFADKGTLGTPIIDAHSDDNATINDNNWHLVTVVGGGPGNTIKFYVDGVAKNTTYPSSYTSLATGNASAATSIGAISSPMLYANATMDDVRIYNRALGANEIASLAVNSSLAADRDGDGLPDYLEDLNGNGTADDPTSWLLYNSPNGLSAGSGLQVFTPLK